MTAYPPELEQAVAERLWRAFDDPSPHHRGFLSLDGDEVGWWLAVAREHLKMQDEAVMEAARKVRDYFAWPWNRTDDTALRRIIGLEGEGEG